MFYNNYRFQSGRIETSIDKFGIQLYHKTKEDRNDKTHINTSPIAAFICVACGDDDEPTGPTGPKEGPILISGSGTSTEFDTFEYGIISFFNWLVISSVNGTDTLIITFFDYQSIKINSAISLTDSSLWIIGSFGSDKFLVTNFNLSNGVSGSMTFTSLDTTGNFSANFSSDATLDNYGITSEQISTAKIAGYFVATKAEVSPSVLSIVRSHEINRIKYSMNQRK